MFDCQLLATHVHKLLSMHFHSLHKPHLKTLSDLIVAMFSIDKFTVRDIAAHLPSDTQVKHKLKRLQNFLDRLNIDEEFWKSHVRMIVSLPYFQPRRRKKMILLLDWTTLKNDYWILALSVKYRDRAIPLYMAVWEKTDTEDDIFGKVKRVIETAKMTLPRKHVTVVDEKFRSPQLLKICEEIGWGCIMSLNDTSMIEMGSIRYIEFTDGKYLATNIKDRDEVILRDFESIISLKEKLDDLKVRLHWEKYTRKLPLKHRMEKLLIVSVMSYAIQLGLGGVEEIKNCDEETITSKFRHIYVSTWRAKQLLF